MLRFDRGELARPRRVGGTLVIEGHAARVHPPADPLRYGGRDEHRDAAELTSIVRQLRGAPVTLAHPTGLIRDGATARIVGRVDHAWIDGEHAAVRMTIDDATAITAIEAGSKELSLGYEVGSVDGNGYQRSTRVDHLALVPTARCGATCAIRTDQCGGTCSCRQKETTMNDRERLDAAAKSRGVRLDAAATDRDAALALLAQLGVNPGGPSCSASDSPNPTPIKTRSDAYVIARALAVAGTSRSRLDSIRHADDDERADADEGPSTEVVAARAAYIARLRGERTDASPAVPNETAAQKARREYVERQRGGRQDATDTTTARDEMIARNRGGR